MAGFVARLGSLLALSCMSLMAHAGSLGVNPIRIVLAESSPTAALTLENTGATPMVVQLRLMQWTADADGDRYEASEDIVATPPIVTIRPGQPQIVRVGLSRAPDPGRELAYRLFFEEVPPPARPGYQGVQVALRVGVPIFVAAAKPGRPDLRWRAVRSANAREVVVQAVNVGSDHARLARLALRAAEPKRDLAEHKVAAYLLPGQKKHWTIPLKEALAERRLRLSAESDLGVTDVDLDVEAP